MSDFLEMAAEIRGDWTEWLALKMTEANPDIFEDRGQAMDYVKQLCEVAIAGATKELEDKLQQLTKAVKDYLASDGSEKIYDVFKLTEARKQLHALLRRGK